MFVVVYSVFKHPKKVIFWLHLNFWMTISKSELLVLDFHVQNDFEGRDLKLIYVCLRILIFKMLFMSLSKFLDDQIQK